jgi:UDP:flavonoid glycosyltransferase YjiC (YdhE family)
VIPDELEQGRHVHPRWLIQLKERGEKLTADTPNPLTIWAEHCAPTVGRIVQQINPVLLISSLFCASLANLLAKRLGVPWCFVNPSFYFGDLGVRAWEEDFVGLAAGWFRYILLPHCDQADLVLHATDREFDPPPYGLPSHHHYIGPLFWEPRQQKDASFLNVPGAPWALVSLSTVPMGGELAIAHSALKALAGKPVRTMLTLAPEYPRSDLGPIPENVMVSGFVPHSQVLNNAALVVSHAGHGIVMKSLYHGVPMVLVPWARDQFGVAARAEALGVAVVVPREDCSDQRLGAAVNRVFEDERYMRKAAEISQRLANETSEEYAYRYIEELMNQYL